MKQTTVLRMLCACLLLGLSFATVSAQSAVSQGSNSLQGSEEAAKKQVKYAAPAAAHEQQKLKNATTIKRVIPSGGNMSQQVVPAPAADRKAQLLQLKAAAAAKGLPTTKYDQELKKLNN